MQDFLNSIHNFGQGVDNAGRMLYNGIRGGTMNFDKTFGIPDDRNTTPLLNPVSSHYTQAPLLATPPPQQQVLAARMQAPLLAPIKSAVNFAQQPQQQAAQPNSLDQLTKQIHQGFTKYGSPPVATVSAALAQAGHGLPDPLLPAVIALKESSGGKNTTYPNNYLNMGHWGYPTMEGAATGGGGHIGIMQQLQDPKYNGPYRDYMKSGDLTDFFKAYTPPGAEGNASIPDQIKQYNVLRSYFTH